MARNANVTSWFVGKAMARGIRVKLDLDGGEVVEGLVTRLHGDPQLARRQFGPRDRSHSSLIATVDGREVAVERIARIARA